MYQYSFGSDNHSGVHPDVMRALHETNKGYCFGYGDDPLTESVTARLKELFGGNCDIWFVMTGTGANAIALQALIQSFNAVICANSSHINVDECGAIQKFTQARLLVIDTPNGKLSPELVLPHMHGRGDQHHSQKRILSITQSTEYGTLYTIDELRDLAIFAHSHKLFLHVDGARLSNAAAALGVSLKEMTKDVGVDILSFGGTKNGMMFGEAIVSFVPDLTHDLIYFRKQSTQLYSKMRYISAQYDAYLKNDLWLHNARHANNMARMLASELRKIDAVSVTQETEVNAVFAILPTDVNRVLQEKYMYYTWDETRGEIRLMCSFETKETDIMAFISDVRTLIANPTANILPNGRNT